MDYGQNASSFDALMHVQFVNNIYSRVEYTREIDGGSLCYHRWGYHLVCHLSTGISSYNQYSLEVVGQQCMKGTTSHCAFRGKSPL